VESFDNTRNKNNLYSQVRYIASSKRKVYWKTISLKTKDIQGDVRRRERGTDEMKCLYKIENSRVYKLYNSGKV